MIGDLGEEIRLQYGVIKNNNKLLGLIKMNSHRSIYAIFLFVLFTIIGQKLLIAILPTGEFIHLEATYWIDWFFNFRTNFINLSLSLIVTIPCYMMLAKLKYILSSIAGFIVGIYLSALFFPYNYRIEVENILLKDNASIFSVIFLYIVILVVIPVLFIALMRYLSRISHT